MIICYADFAFSLHDVIIFSMFFRCVLRPFILVRVFGFEIINLRLSSPVNSSPDLRSVITILLEVVFGEGLNSGSFYTEVSAYNLS